MSILNSNPENPFDRLNPEILSPPKGPGSVHERWMRQALIEAKRAFDINEVPIGCVIVQSSDVGDGRIIARGHNLTEQLKDATAHAEMMAITSASAALESRYLTDVTLYATIEACPMCAGAIVLARIPRSGLWRLRYKGWRMRNAL